MVNHLLLHDDYEFLFSFLTKQIPIYSYANHVLITTEPVKDINKY